MVRRHVFQYGLDTSTNPVKDYLQSFMESQKRSTCDVEKRK